MKLFPWLETYEDMLKSEAVCEIILHYADTTVICKCIKRGKDVTWIPKLIVK